MAVCWRCGTTDEKCDTWRICSVRGEYVCINCEKSCPYYTAKLTYSGTNCLKSYHRMDRREKALNRVFITGYDAKKQARKRFEQMTNQDLWATYVYLLNRYDLETNDMARADKRTSLAALKELIIERGGINCGR